MTKASDYRMNPELDLMIEKIIDVPPETVWKAYTTPKHLMAWFCPKPWKVTDCKIDLRPGGNFETLMEGPNGEKMPTAGCYVEVIENKKLVWTDAMTANYRPAEKSFMTAMIFMEPYDSGTKYTAYAIHRTVEDRKTHEQMGFKEGWSITLDQLATYMKSQ